MTDDPLVHAHRRLPRSANPTAQPDNDDTGRTKMDREDPWANGLIDKPTEEAILRAIGDLLRRARLGSGMRLGELAARCGVSQSVLCRVELARRPPSIAFLMTVCSRLGIRVSDVFRAAEDAAVPLPTTPRPGRFHELVTPE
jgi:ribosome-binding protein aMBF1 (putative translation factor)